MEIKAGAGHFDRAFSVATSETLPAWKYLGFTPNGLTTLGLGSSAAAVYFYWENNVPMAVASILLRMYFDQADGLMARRYGMASEFGDVYDHVVDAVFWGGFLIVTYRRFQKYRLHVLSALVLCMVASAIYLECVESQCTGGACSQTLKIWSPLGIFCGPWAKFTDIWITYAVALAIVVARDRLEPK